MNGLCLSAASSPGRHECKSAWKAFGSMCFKLETCCESDLYTLEDLHALMCACLERAYSIKHVKSLLCERYGDNVCIAEVSGR